MPLTEGMITGLRHDPSLWNARCLRVGLMAVVWTMAAFPRASLAADGGSSTAMALPARHGPNASPDSGLVVDLRREVDAAALRLAAEPPHQWADIIRTQVLSGSLSAVFWSKDVASIANAIAAIRLLGGTHDGRWSTLLAGAYQAAPIGGDKIPGELEHNEILTAWLSVTRPNLTVQTALPWLRTMLCQPAGKGLEQAAAPWWLYRHIKLEGWTSETLSLFSDPSPCVRLGVAYNVAADDLGTPAARAHVVALLLDPDPKIRNFAQQRLSVFPWGGALWIPAFIAFLNRSDVTPKARAVVEKGMHIRGYRAVKVGGHWVAQPLSGAPGELQDGGVALPTPPEGRAPSDPSSSATGVAPSP